MSWFRFTNEQKRYWKKLAEKAKEGNPDARIVFDEDCFGEGVTKIDNEAFTELDIFDEIRIPDGVKEIGNWTFFNCKSLRKIHIPDSVEEIDDGAFAGCSSLQEIHIPDGVTKIDYGAFHGCDSLKKIHIPEGVKEIGEYAFWGCKSLQEINIPEGTEVADNAFDYCNDSLKIIRYKPEEKKERKDRGKTVDADLGIDFGNDDIQKGLGE